ncbi:MAG: bifunctional phosphoribosylaminoimidazolecarboxamide formyltransferase/IMP cyclohydrolase [Planctomycetota bacterium]
MNSNSTSATTPPTRRALLSVSDKTGIRELAHGLAALGFELYSTGGTRKHLEEAGLAVIDVAQYTGFPEVMHGRVKTLHPKIFGGILCRRDEAEDQQAIRDLEIRLFDCVVVNLYPFRETIARADSSLSDAIENIDIGGPSLIRAAAKNHAWVNVLTDSSQYPALLDQLRSTGETSLSFRRQLMATAFAHTAEYDRLIADYFGRQFLESAEPFPEKLQLALQRVDLLRYGENSHQQAALYAFSESTALVTAPALVTARQLNGKQLSYNNLLDAEAALAIVRNLSLPACCVIKHNNPCGAAQHANLALACERAFAGDPVSAFGSVVGINRTVDVETAEFFCSHRELFVEAIVAPDFDPLALQLLSTKPKWKANVRLIATGSFVPPAPQLEYRSLSGGLLVQTSDNLPDDSGSWQLVAGSAPDAALLRELEFGWTIVRQVKSNAITVSGNSSLYGVGAGQMSRVDSVRIALEKAGERARGGVLASDAFFPFPDSIPLAAEAGIKAIVQPGGSVKDPDVIAAAKELGLTMLLTGVRHFKH